MFAEVYFWFCFKSAKIVVVSEKHQHFPHILYIKEYQQWEYVCYVIPIFSRQVLSSDHTDVHQSAVTVVSLVVKAAQQALDEEKRKKNKHKGIHD